MNELDSTIKKFHNTIVEALLNMDSECATEFIRIFKEKINEQKCSKKNSGPPR